MSIIDISLGVITMKTMKTYKFRIKDSSRRNYLRHVAGKVNYIWNWLNNVSRDLWDLEGDNKHWLSQFDAQNLLAGSSSEIDLNAATIQLIAQEHANKRKQAKKSKLNWRSAKNKTLGWIPFDTRAVTIKDDTIYYMKKSIRFWKHREIEGKFKSGCFVQDHDGRWYVCLVCEQEIQVLPKTGKNVGIDLGFKELAVTSDGEHFEHPKATRKYAEKLARAKRYKNKKQEIRIYRKIKNIRKDFNHKVSSHLVQNYDKIFIGNVSSEAMIQKGKGFAKSTLDASWGQFKTMVEYKCSKAGRIYSLTDERYSTVTCSVCSKKGDHTGLKNLGVREWVCAGCGTKHQRDHNAAINILNWGLKSLEGDPVVAPKKVKKNKLKFSEKDVDNKFTAE
jgi:IS605 OrfB family transposase